MRTSEKTHREISRIVFVAPSNLRVDNEKISYFEQKRQNRAPGGVFVHPRCGPNV